MTTKAKRKPTPRKRRNGEGSISYDAKRDLYVAQLTVDGRRRTVSARREADCVRKLDELKSELRRGAIITARKGLTVGMILDHWLTVSVPNEPTKHGTKAAPGTRLNQGAYVRRLKGIIGDRAVASLTVDDVEKCYRSVALGTDKREGGGPRKPAGVDYLHRIRITLNRAIADGVRRQKVSDQIARVVADAQLPLSLAKPAGERIALTPDEMSKLIEASKDHRLHAMILLAMTLGLRPGELTGLYWSDLHLDENPPYVSLNRAVQRQGNNRFAVGPMKNAGAYRDLELTPDAVRALRSHRKRQLVEQVAASSWADPNLVFPSTRGTVLNPSNVRREFDRLTTLAGVPRIVPYEARHSVATMLSDDPSLSTFQIVDFLGHDDDRMLNRVYRKKRKAIVRGATAVVVKNISV